MRKVSGAFKTPNYRLQTWFLEGNQHHLKKTWSSLSYVQHFLMWYDVWFSKVFLALWLVFLAYLEKQMEILEALFSSLFWREGSAFCTLQGWIKNMKILLLTEFGLQVQYKRRKIFSPFNEDTRLPEFPPQLFPTSVIFLSVLFLMISQCDR